MTTHAGTVAAFDARASLTRNILALTSGLTLWTAVHFGVTAILPLLLHDQGYDARGIGFMLGAMGIAQLALRPFAGWIVDAFGRRTPLGLSLVLLASASALLFSPVGWAVLANRVLTGAAYSLGTTAFFTLVVEAAPPGRHGEVQGYVALGITLGAGLGPLAAVALFQRFSPGTVPAERMTSVAFGAVAVALSSGVCFSAVSSTFRARGRAHPYALRTNFRREGLLPALLNFCTQIPNVAFSTFLSPVGYRPRREQSRHPPRRLTGWSGGQPTPGWTNGRSLWPTPGARSGSRRPGRHARGHAMRRGSAVPLRSRSGLRHALRRRLRDPPEPRRRGGAGYRAWRRYQHDGARRRSRPAPGSVGPRPRCGYVGLRRSARRGGRR